MDGDVRLAEGNDPMQGRVQMCFDGVFGTVCDTTVWTGQDATVVCTQLGYPILLPGMHIVVRAFFILHACSTFHNVINL